MIKTITKTVLVEGNKQFNIGDDVAFTTYSIKTNCIERYIARILEIHNDYILVDKLEINRDKVGGKFAFFFEDMLELNFVAR